MCFTAALPACVAQTIVLTQYALSSVHLIGAWYARSAHPRAKIFLATHTYSDARANEHMSHSPSEAAMLAALNITVVPIAENATELHAKLRANYRHASGQGVVYERFCMARFLSALYILDAHGLRNALMFDMDVATTMDLTAAFGPGDWGFGSFISSWTRDSLANFAAFITDFYDGDGLHVANKLRAHGGKIPKEARENHPNSRRSAEAFVVACKFTRACSAGCVPRQAAGRHGGLVAEGQRPAVRHHGHGDVRRVHKANQQIPNVLHREAQPEVGQERPDAPHVLRG